MIRKFLFGKKSMIGFYLKAKKKQTIAPNGMNLIKKDFCDIAQVYYQEDLKKGISYWLF